jgi:hypothetical protein
VTISESPLPTCVNHPSRETALRCGKCGNPICTRCVIQTPVGGRCRTCANLRRLPQYDVDLPLFLRSALAGLAVSIVAWWLLAYVPSLRFFFSIFAGLAIGEVMSRLARRRSNLVLEAAAVSVVILGFAAVEAVHPGTGDAFSRFGGGYGATYEIVPIVFASIAAVVKLR